MLNTKTHAACPAPAGSVVGILEHTRRQMTDLRDSSLPCARPSGLLMSQGDEHLSSGERVYYDDNGVRYVVDDAKRRVRKARTCNLTLLFHRNSRQCAGPV